MYIFTKKFLKKRKIIDFFFLKNKPIFKFIFEYNNYKLKYFNNY
jgi:hypothetical protein